MMAGLFQNIAFEIIAGVVFSLAVALGMWIENRYDLIPQKDKRNHKARLKLVTAHNCILQAEMLIEGEDKGLEKMQKAIELYIEHYPSASEAAAFEYLSQVFVTTVLYHNNHQK
jgi:hypothetical protein